MITLCGGGSCVVLKYDKICQPRLLQNYKTDKKFGRNTFPYCMSQEPKCVMVSVLQSMVNADSNRLGSTNERIHMYIRVCMYVRMYMLNVAPVPQAAMTWLS